MVGNAEIQEPLLRDLVRDFPGLTIANIEEISENIRGLRCMILQKLLQNEPIDYP